MTMAGAGRRPRGGSVRLAGAVRVDGPRRSHPAAPTRATSPLRRAPGRSECLKLLPAHGTRRMKCADDHEGRTCEAVQAGATPRGRLGPRAPTTFRRIFTGRKQVETIAGRGTGSCVGAPPVSSNPLPVRILAGTLRLAFMGRESD